MDCLVSGGPSDSVCDTSSCVGDGKFQKTRPPSKFDRIKKINPSGSIAHYNEDRASMSRAAKKYERKVITDCIHGQIELPPAAIAIIDTKQFQRLRNLKQCGTSHLVFPNATHNRFQHSIGVGFLAGKFGANLMGRYPQWMDEKDVLCLMIAGLCHDLGHGPYSHLWERFINEADPGAGYRHEVSSIRMLDCLLIENDLKPILLDLGGIDETDILFIKELIAGEIDSQTGIPPPKKVSGDGEWLYRGRGEEKSFLYEIVANDLNGVDVDKWDYFLRDDYYLKIGHVFDYERFIKYSKVETVGPPNRRRKRICLRDKEAENLLEMYKDRARLHRNGYQHRVALIADRMMLDAWLMANTFVKVSSKADKCYSLSQSSQMDMIAHAKLTDDYVKSVVQDSVHPDAEATQKIFDRIDSRNFYKDISCLIINEDDAQSKMTQKEILEDIQSFIDPKIREDNPELALGEQDLTVLRQKVTPGITFEEIYFYDKQGEVTKADPNSFRKSLNEASDKIFICVKRPELASEASAVVSKWLLARGLQERAEHRETK